MFSAPILLAAALILGLTSCAPPDTTLAPDPPRAMVPMTHPLAGVRLADDPTADAVQWKADHDADWLSPITSQPTAHWIAGPDSLTTLPKVLSSARRQRAVPVLVAYDIPNRSCDPSRQGAADDVEYATFVHDLVVGLGRNPAVVILEPDILPSDCFGPPQAAMLQSALRELRQAGHHVYLSAGPPSWRSPAETANRLLQAGITEAEGFAVDISGRASLAESVSFGEQVSDLVGLRDYVVDTGRAGTGTRSPTNPGGVVSEDWCNPPGQALGPRPDTRAHVPGATHLAATLWIKPPGLSDGNVAARHGNCHGETVPGGHFSATQARTLIAGESTIPADLRAGLLPPDETGDPRLAALTRPTPATTSTPAVAPRGGGSPRPEPQGGVEAGGGSTAGIEDVTLFGVGGAALLGGLGALLFARRRRQND